MSVSVPGVDGHVIDVVRAERAYGEPFQTANGVTVSTEFVTFTDTIEYESGGMDVAGEDRNLATHRVTARNPTDESRSVPDGHEFEAVVREYRERSTVSWKGRTVSSPELGPMYSPRIGSEINAGTKLSGVIGHEVPAEASPEDVALHGFFAVDRDTDQHCLWTHESRLNEER